MNAKRVAFLSTGEELINADFLDTNSVTFAQALVDHQIQPGQRLLVGDKEEEIEAAIRYLLSGHEALITIGGLGPTSDDRTRYGISKATERELIFNDQAWEWVVDHFTRKHLEIPETNRQQALFPKGAHIIPNPAGTAAACYLSVEKKDLFMLPGPPNEARPIFDNHVLPHFLQNHYASPVYRHSWLLLGVSESRIADQLEKWMTDSGCHLGYRVHYPYLEIKLWSEDLHALTRLQERFQEILKASTISEKNKSASTQLIEYLKKHDDFLLIQDEATYGHLAATLHRPDTQTKIAFAKKEAATPKNIIEIKINGLDRYWQGAAEADFTAVSITVQSAKTHKTIERKIPIRTNATPFYAVEIICWEILCSFQPQFGV